MLVGNRFLFLAQKYQDEKKNLGGEWRKKTTHNAKTKTVRPESELLSELKRRSPSAHVCDAPAGRRRAWPGPSHHSGSSCESDPNPLNSFIGKCNIDQRGEQAGGRIRVAHSLPRATCQGVQCGRLEADIVRFRNVTFV